MNIFNMLKHANKFLRLNQECFCILKLIEKGVSKNSLCVFAENSMNFENISQEVLEFQETVYGHRRSLHEIAELGLREYKTAEYIRNRLDSLGIQHDALLETSVTGIIKGSKGERTVAFRADMDGLNAGDGSVRHLCGHDGHMSVLLGLVEYLWKRREFLKDNVVFIFQPAEESPGGALPLINAGLIEKYGIKEIYGLHMYPDVSEGLAGVRPLYFLSGAGEVNIEITGKSGHGAMPQDANDSIVAAAGFISALQTIISRNIRPLDEGVLTIGRIEGGSRRNIISGNVRLEGTIRAFKDNVYEKIKERIYEVARGFETVYGCKIDVSIKDDYPPVNNDERLFEEFREAVGEENISLLEPLMIAEDFSYYQRKIPGLFFMLGSRNEDLGFTRSLHNIDFNFDEKALIFGLEFYIRLLRHKGVIA